MKTKIFCCNFGGSYGWMHAVALGADGRCVASHVCSDTSFMPHDLGITSDWKHDKYDAAYPDGWELVDLTKATEKELDAHPEFQAAWALNQAQKKADDEMDKALVADQEKT